MKFYVKADRNGIVFLAVLVIIVDILLLYFGMQENDFLVSGCIALALTLFVSIGWIMLIGEGLFIDGDSLCYKAIRKKYYSVEDVKGLHIVKAQIVIGRYFSTWTLKNRYVIIYLKDRDFEWGNHEGSIDFWKWHRKHILFTTTYDENVIEYFKTKNIPITGCI